MKRLLPTMVFLLFASSLHSQLLTWTPTFPVDSDNLIIIMDAGKGNQGLNNYSNPDDVFVHIGLITNASSNSGDWKHTIFTWGTTTSAAKTTSLGNNKYNYTINNIRSFFSVGPGEIIYKIAILFRNGNGSSVQRNADGSDMFVPVYDNSLAIRFTNPPLQPKYSAEAEPINKSLNDNLSVTAISNRSATLTLYLNGALIQTDGSVSNISANPVLTMGGENILIAEAIEGAEKKNDSIKFFVSRVINTAPLPAGAKDGINYGPDNTRVTLVLFAPGKNRVSVIGEFAGSNWTEQPQYQMNNTPDGNYWWLTIEGLAPAKEYAFQYLVDGNLKVGEPYAEKVLDPFNDGFIPASHYPSLKAYPAGQSGNVSILQTAAPTYTWGITNFSRPDKRNLIIYEMLLRDFLSAANWNVLRDTLEYLKRMGINVIELMPVNEFDSNDSWGYNPSYFLAPDKYYGQKNLFKQFIDSCHARGIAVIMDIALNHASGSCPLAALYWNASANQTAANNPWFNTEAKHPFNVFHDFNHESRATQYFFKRVVEHWLTEYKIDGFRFDLSKGFTQFNSGNNVALWNQYDASRVALWKMYYDSLQVISPGSYVILEHFADNTEEKELSDYGMMFWGNSNYNFSEAAMGWITNSNFDYGLHSVRGWTNPFLVSYMESHDEER
ncbi:MAG: alpha-amylase family glycosyl hydrolase, partial [Chitinophagaceae bacterium]